MGSTPTERNMTNRIIKRLIDNTNHFQLFQEVLDEIRADYYNGILTAEQRRKHERDAHMDLAGKMNELEAMVRN